MRFGAGRAAFGSAALQGAPCCHWCVCAREGADGPQNSSERGSRETGPIPARDRPKSITSDFRVAGKPFRPWVGPASGLQGRPGLREPRRGGSRRGEGVRGSLAGEAGSPATGPPERPG